MFAIMKIAAAALLAAGGWFYFACVRSMEASAFAEMAQKMKSAHTLAYRMTIESSTLKNPSRTRVIMSEPGLLRMEMKDGSIVINDWKQGKTLNLNPADKTFTLHEWKDKAPRGSSGPATSLERWRQLIDGDAKPLGRKTIGGIQAEGYRITGTGTETTLWINPTTRSPVQIESKDRVMGRMSGKDSRSIVSDLRTTMTDFQIDPEIDDALFRLEPPPGYTRSTKSVFSGSVVGVMGDKTLPEKATAEYLRLFAEKTGGRFPKHLDDLTEFDQVFPNKKSDELPDEATKRAMISAIRFMNATKQLKGGFGYRPAGVTLGDADKILFWYRPEGASKYRVLYGDLHASDVTEDKLPEKPGR